MHTEQTLMKLNMYIYILIKDDLLEKYNEVWQKLKAVSKSNLIVNLCTMNNQTLTIEKPTQIFMMIKY